MQKTIAATVLLASLAVLQSPVFAQNEGRAQLRLTVVDENKAPLPNVNVTVFTMNGPRTVHTDAKGVVVVADLPAAMTQWSARTPGLANADASRLKPGENKQTLTLRIAKSATESGS